MDAKSYVNSLPLDSDLKRRILMTCNCLDSEDIAKVDRAGEIFTGDDGSYQLMHNGIKIVEGCYHGRGITEIIRLLRGHHEPQEEKVFFEILRHIKPGATMIELGSHWSYYSMWFQKEVPAAKNYMIEPDPKNIEVGKRNFQINEMSGQFFNAFIGGNSSPPAPFHCESDNQIRMIPQLCIDDFIVDNDINYVELLFADIQGYEYQMLQGATKSIEGGKIRFIFISTHHHLISGDPIIHHRCLDFLVKHNAHIIASHTVVESYSGDGLIVASFLADDLDIPEISISRNYPSNSLFRELEFDLEDARQEIARLRLKIDETVQTTSNPKSEVESRLNSRFVNKLRNLRKFLARN